MILRRYFGTETLKLDMKKIEGSHKMVSLTINLTSRTLDYY